MKNTSPQQEKTIWEYAVDTEFMRGLSPVGNLSQRNRAQLLKKARYERLVADITLDADAERNWIIYVMNDMASIDENNRLVTSVTLSAEKTQPLSPLFQNAGERKVKIKRGGLLVRFDRHLYETLEKNDNADNIEVNIVETSMVEDDIFMAIIHDYQHNQIEVPALSDIALRIKKTIDDPNATTGAIADMLMLEPVLAAKLIQHANSVLFTGLNPVHSLKDVVARLGLSHTRQLVMTHVIADLLRDMNTSIKSVADEVYEHSLYTAAICYQLAKTRTRLDPDRALLTGLLHDIGVFVILYHLNQRKLIDDISSEGFIDALLDKMHGMVGAMVLQQWKFDPEFIVAAEEGDNVYRYGKDEIEYCDLLIVAHWCYSAYVRNEMNKLPATNRIPAFAKLGFADIDLNDLSHTFHDMRTQIAQVISLLR